MSTVLDRLFLDHPVILDGAMGTELARRGVPLPPHLWSAAALLTHPDEVKQIHADFVQAGAEWLTANTFRAHRRNLAKAGIGDQAGELTRHAVRLAKEAAEESKASVWVVGSLAPLEDCYRPQDVPNGDALNREHAEMAENLADADVDLILVETQNTIREAVAATKAASATGIPVAVSFVCGGDGRLLSGERLADAANAVCPHQPAAVLVNCLPANAVPQSLKELKQNTGGLPIGVYANTGIYDAKRGWIPTPLEEPDNYAEAAKSWRGLGAKILGGCCGTTPNHIRRLREELSI